MHSIMRTYTRKKLPVEHIEDVQSLCRLCLGKTEEMTAVFEDESDMYMGLPSRIVTCLGLEVSREDVLPKCICQQCKVDLDHFYAFKKKCTTTYWKLKTMLSGSTKRDTSHVGLSNEHKMNHTSTLGNEEKLIVSAVDSFPVSPHENKILVEVPSHMSVQKERKFTDKNIFLGEIDTRTELNNVEVDSCATPVSNGIALPTNCSLQINKDEHKQGNEISRPLHKTISDENIDVVQEENTTKVHSSDNVKNAELLSEYLVAALVDRGVLARREAGLELLQTHFKTFQLETAHGSNIILELVEEDGEEVETSYSANSDNDGRVCGACGLRLSSRGALRRHQRVHSGERPFACAACPRRFTQREVLRRHQLLHADKLPFQCPACPKAYTQRGALEAHARSHAPPGPPPAPRRCTRCPKQFLHASGLSRHMSVHRGRGYQCEQCARSFSDKSSLRRHARAHQR